MTDGNDSAKEMTKRELFAAMAMQGLSTIVQLKASEIARYAVETADALIAELNKEKGV